jgi:RNA polymerase sigma-70 factor (ECF subfamily)
MTAAGALVLSEGHHISRDESDQPLNIAALTAQMAKGDEAAYRTFYERYFGRLLRYLLVVTAGNIESAQEALQMTLLRVARHAKPFASEEALWSWLTVLARSAVVDETRRRSRYLAMLDRFLKRREVDACAADHEADEQFRSSLDNELAALPADERALIERKYFDGISVQTIAAESGTTEGAVESRLVRVRRKLREAVLAHLKDERRSEH